jgi:GR25 family glycosyltransferase involved in LPS biosynthesis
MLITQERKKNMKDYFDKIFCINLDRRKDRWEETVQELKKWGVFEGINRISAVDGNKIKNTTKLKNGELGLLETHLKILRNAKTKKYKNILLIEDDIEFTKEIQNLESYFNELPKNWDMLWFGGNHNTHAGNKINLVSDKIIKCNNTYSTHCFAINNSVYDILIDIILKREKPVDVYYSDIQKTHNCFSFNPSIAIQRPSFSDIQNVYEDNRWLF